MEWQPIETAPRDGRRIMVYCPSNGCIYHVRAGDARSHEAEGWHIFCDRCFQFWRYYPPSHWRAEPEPPLERNAALRWLRDHPEYEAVVDSRPVIEERRHE